MRRAGSKKVGRTSYLGGRFVDAARRCGRKWPTLAATSESAYSKPARKRRHVGSARSDDARKIAGRERRRSERIGGQMQLDVSFERNEIYECGAVLLTLLACPKELDKPRSLDRFLSLCGKALWLKHLASPDDLSPITVRPPYVFRHPDTIDRDVHFVEKRLGERMVAGRMAIAFLRRADSGATPPLPQGIKRLSLNEMAAFVAEDAGQVDPINVERRVWAPSRPVIHLAAAAAMLGQRRNKGGIPTGLETFLLDRGFVEEVSRQAERLRALIASDAKFPVKAEQLVPFRLG